MDTNRVNKMMKPCSTHTAMAHSYVVPQLGGGWPRVVVQKAAAISLHALARSSQAQEKVTLLRTFGAEVIQVRTASIANPENYINVAARLAKERKEAVFMDQFETEANMDVHFHHTGPEIWQQSRGRLAPEASPVGDDAVLAHLALQEYVQSTDGQIRRVVMSSNGLLDVPFQECCLHDRGSHRGTNSRLPLHN